jgi:alanine racemase
MMTATWWSMATDPAFAAGKAVLTIDLDALARNYQRLCQEARGVEVAGVVKADGYGLGALEVADALWHAGCRKFFVAHVDEGLELRASLPQAAIYVLNGPPPGALADLVAARLIPVLNHPGELAAWAAHARRRGERLPAVVHIDSGMCRLGFSAAEVRAIEKADLEAVDLGLVMSHLACAEERDNPLNEQQRRRFEELRRHLPAVPACFANSSGIFLGPAYHFDLCRPGVALYGVNPTPDRHNPMAPVVTLEAPVLQVHEIDEPGSVGYGATCATRPGMRIATVPVGYADGYLRSASNRARARIGDDEVLVAGRVSMDLITLDVTGLPADVVRPGTPVTLIGGASGIDQLAAAAGTIGYEVLTRLGRRFARRYIPAGPTKASA